MNRLDRFENSRFIGFRKNMKVYDCDNEDQYSKLLAMTKNLDYIHIDHDMIYELIEMMKKVEKIYKKRYDTKRIY